MGEQKKLSVFDDPRQARYAGWLVVGLLCIVALMLRLALDFDGVLDTDVMNFGLASYRFNVLEHQPHPPGYPGYVVFLKVIHALFSGLSPIDVAKWGARCCGVLVIPTAYWATRQIIDDRLGVREGLWAAGIAVFHPILWFYGGDGQSHSAEALLTLLLIGLTVNVSKREGLTPRLLLVVAFALAGSVRPTIALLGSPLLVWVFWGRAFKDWFWAGVVGVATVLAWYAPLIHFSGGLDLYRRATRALVKELFINNFSVFGERASLQMIVINMAVTFYSSLLALIPLLALRRIKAGWFNALLFCVVANVLFYALLFTAESGYLSAVAAIAILVPATWPLASRSHRLRGGIVLVFSFLMVWFGPQSAKLPWAPGMFLPTMQHVVGVHEAQTFHKELLCGAANDKATLVLTDNPVTTHNRWLPMRCPNMTVAIYLHDFFFRDELDNWLIFKSDGMLAVPPPVPLEPGPPSTTELPYVETILISPGTTPKWRKQILEAATCEPIYLDAKELGETQVLVSLPASCLPTLRFGIHTLAIEGYAPKS